MHDRLSPRRFAEARRPNAGGPDAVMLPAIQATLSRHRRPGNVVQATSRTGRQRLTYSRGPLCRRRLQSRRPDLSSEGDASGGRSGFH